MAWLWNEHRWMRSVVDSMVHDVTTSRCLLLPPPPTHAHVIKLGRCVFFRRKDAGCCRSVGLWMIETNNALPPQPLMRTEDVLQRSVSVVPRPNVTQSGRLAAQRDTWTQICFWSQDHKRKIKSSSPDVAKSVGISQRVFVMGTGTALLSVSIHFSNPAISLPAKHCDAVTFASKHRLYYGSKDTHTHAHPPGVWLAPFLCLQGDKTVKVVPVNQQPPIAVADLIAGAKYHLRVYSHELNSISSKPLTFETKAGETAPGEVEPGFQPGGLSLSLV